MLLLVLAQRDATWRTPAFTDQSRQLRTTKRPATRSGMPVVFLPEREITPVPRFSLKSSYSAFHVYATLPSTRQPLAGARESATSAPCDTCAPICELSRTLSMIVDVSRSFFLMSYSATVRSPRSSHTLVFSPTSSCAPFCRLKSD